MFYKAFLVEGTANVTELDDGLMSTVEVPVKVRAVIINCTVLLGNVIEGGIGTQRVLEIYDYCLDTREGAASDLPSYSTTKMGRIPIELDVPAGLAFKIGVRSGGTESDICGAYEYEEIT